MNKIFNRQLFRTAARKPSAHGSGITQLVVDGQHVQKFADGPDELGVRPAWVDEANMRDTRTDVGAMGSDIPLEDFGFPINSDLRVNGRGAPPVRPPSYDEEPVQYAEANTGTATDARPPSSAPPSTYTPLTTEQIIARDAQMRTMLPKGIASINSDDVAEKAKKYAEMYQKMYPGKSAEQYLEERKRLMGDDKESYQLQAALELAKLGATMASTPGSLATALAAGVNAAAPGLQKIADKRTERDRALKLAAFDAAERDQQMKAQLGIKGLETAVSQSFQERQAEISRVAQENAATLSRIAHSQDAQETRMFQELARKDTQAFQEGQSNKSQELQLFMQNPITFFKRDPEAPKGIVVKSFKAAKTPEGYAYVDDEGNKKSSEWTPFTETTAKLVSTDLDKPQQGHVIDKTSVNGLRSVPIAWDKTQAKMMMADGTGKWREAPTDLLVANTQELIDRKPTKDGAYIDTLVKAGPYEGLFVRQDPSGNIQNVEEVTNFIKSKGGDPSKIKGLGVSEPQQQEAAPGQQGAAPGQQGAVQVTEVLPQPLVEERDKAISEINKRIGNKDPSFGQITGKGAEKYLVEALPASSTSGSKMTEKDREDAQRKVLELERGMRTLYSASRGAYKTTSFVEKGKSVVTNVLDPLTSMAGIDLAYPATEAGRTEMLRLRSEIIKAFAQNPDRVSVYEQSQIAPLAGDVDKWLSNPRTTLEKVRELYRLSQNEMEAERARLEGRAPLMMMRVPTGTKNDPFTYDPYGAFTSFMINSGQSDFFNGKYVQGSEGGPPRLWGGVKR